MFVRYSEGLLGYSRVTEQAKFRVNLDIFVWNFPRMSKFPNENFTDQREFDFGADFGCYVQFVPSLRWRNFAHAGALLKFHVSTNSSVRSLCFRTHLWEIHTRILHVNIQIHAKFEGCSVTPFKRCLPISHHHPSCTYHTSSKAKTTIAERR